MDEVHSFELITDRSLRRAQIQEEFHNQWARFLQSGVLIEIVWMLANDRWYLNWIDEIEKLKKNVVLPSITICIVRIEILFVENVCRKFKFKTQYEQLQRFLSQNSSRSIRWSVVYNDWLGFKWKYVWYEYDDGNHWILDVDEIDVDNRLDGGSSSWI